MLLAAGPDRRFKVQNNVAVFSWRIYAMAITWDIIVIDHHDFQDFISDGQTITSD